ncbi:MAG: ATP-binding cassette domain-containing protein [Desulfobulbaceae bacterium]|nr:MAG: ATP-binding cassette domain-containing protein [Desulfobulbaceae bacterium]
MTLVLEHITITLNNQPLFTEVNLRVEPGRIVTLMGPSGCGKSTLLSAIFGNLAPCFRLSGEIVLGDRLLNPLPMEQRRVGILFQDDLLFPHLDVAGNMSFALPAGTHRHDKKQIISESLDRAGLSGFEHRDVATLSGGQKARVSLLRTLLAKPQAILLDEPFSKLDQELKQSVRSFVFAQIRTLNIPALLVTHDPEDAPDEPIFNLGAGNA